MQNSLVGPPCLNFIPSGSRFIILIRIARMDDEGEASSRRAAAIMGVRKRRRCNARAGFCS